MSTAAWVILAITGLFAALLLWVHRWVWRHVRKARGE